VWFYEHTTRFGVHDKKKYPRIASWAKVDHGGRYDAFKLVADIKESEVWEIGCTVVYKVVHSTLNLGKGHMNCNVISCT